MFTLHCIKDPVPFVIIGGISGIGKTTIIDSLLANYSNIFSQPLSYTTRGKRNENDRYEFISSNKIKELNANGELLNLDYVHGEYYGVSRVSVDEIKQSGKVPIKEIHPQNFHKFNVKGLDTINVLIERKDLCHKSIPFTFRGNRQEEDFVINEYSEYDLRLNIAGLTPDEAAGFLLKKIFAFRLHNNFYPHSKLIEELNKKSYDKIAEEFNDRDRITSKNFHDASLQFWVNTLNNSSTLNTVGKPKVLEFGPGNGWLFSKINSSGYEIYGVELSSNMKISYCDHLFICSARNTPFKANFFDLVVGSLIDPLLTPELFIEVERILKPGGEFIFTTPTFEWASNFDERENINKTVFQNKKGEKVETFSFCNTINIFYNVIGIANLEIVKFDSLYLREDYQDPISPALTNSAKKSGKDLKHFPIVNGIIIKKTI